MAAVDHFAFAGIGIDDGEGERVCSLLSTIIHSPHSISIAFVQSKDDCLSPNPALPCSTLSQYTACYCSLLFDLHVPHILALLSWFAFCW
jgi:hypothetical protein